VEGIFAHRWWHTIEVAPGTVTPGAWDLRGLADRIPWPESLVGARCLDIGQPLARLAPRPGYLEWWVFNTAGLRRALDVAGFRREAESPLLQY